MGRGIYGPWQCPPRHRLSSSTTRTAAFASGAWTRSSPGTATASCARCRSKATRASASLPAFPAIAGSIPGTWSSRRARSDPLGTPPPRSLDCCPAGGRSRAWSARSPGPPSARTGCRGQPRPARAPAADRRELLGQALRLTPAPSIRSDRGRNEAQASRRRALPDRRQLARLPRVLRAPRVDRDRRRAADERDLRLRLDDGQAPGRLRAGHGDRRLGQGMSGREKEYPEYKARPQVAPGPPPRAVAAPGAAGRGVRLRQRPRRGLRGRRRDRHARDAGEGAGRP